jgi:hypothetical protein
MPCADGNSSKEQELIEEYERHGCYLVPHLRREFEDLWQEECIERKVVDVERKIGRLFDSLEMGYPLLEFRRGLLPLVSTAPDAYGAYRWLRNSGEAVPTYRWFLKVCRLAGPMLADLLDRESDVLRRQRQGLGPRACPDCRLDWMGGEF